MVVINEIKLYLEVLKSSCEQTIKLPNTFNESCWYKRIQEAESQILVIKNLLDFIEKDDYREWVLSEIKKGM